MNKGKGMLLLMGGDKEEEDYGDESGSMEETAMKNLRAAMKSGDDTASVKAMKAFMEACYPKLASDDDSE